MLVSGAGLTFDECMDLSADAAYLIQNPEQLAAVFGEAGEASIRKEVSFVHPHYRALIEASPFAILATCGTDGLDASPRGDPPGFVVVQDEHTLLLPERRGNNRIDSLRNILTDSRVALLFLIPGHGETLRVNGRARISVEPGLLQRFAVDGKPPKCVLIITVNSVFFQCARAIHRSQLWQVSNLKDRPQLPSAGTILESLTDAAINGQEYDAEAPIRQQATLY